MKIKIKKIIALAMIVGLIYSIPVSARTVQNFNFAVVVYNWTTSARTAFVTKTTSSSSGVVNTLTSSNGYVSGNVSFNAELLRKDPRDENDNIRVGHCWGISANSRTLIPYTVNPGSLVNVGVMMGLSTRSDGLQTSIRGSWSPDTN